MVQFFGKVANCATTLKHCVLHSHGPDWVRTSAPTGVHWIVHFPQSQRLARARGPNHSHARGAKRYLRGHAQHPAHEYRTSRTCFRTFPMSSGWRRRGGRITLMHRASGSTYRGGVLGQPAGQPSPAGSDLAGTQPAPTQGHAQREGTPPAPPPSRRPGRGAGAHTSRLKMAGLMQ